MPNVCFCIISDLFVISVFDLCHMYAIVNPCKKMHSSGNIFSLCVGGLNMLI